jgi:hypothetical protein
VLEHSDDHNQSEWIGMEWNERSGLLGGRKDFWRKGCNLCQATTEVERVSTTRKALLGGNIDIMVNDYTNQQIRSTTAQYIFKE